MEQKNGWILSSVRRYCFRIKPLNDFVPCPIGETPSSLVRNHWLIVIIFVVSFLLNVVPSTGQTTRIDSLKQVLRTLKGKDKVLCQLEIASAFGQHNIDSAMARIHAVSLIPGLDSNLWLMTERKKARLLTEIGQGDSAQRMVRRLLPIAKRIGNIEYYYLLRNSVALHELENGRFSQAFTILYENLIYYRRTGNTEDYWITLGNIGFAYYKLKHFSKAVEYYNASLRLAPEKQQIVEPPYVNLMLAYAYCGQFDSSYYAYELSLKNTAFRGQPRECVNTSALGIVLFLDNRLRESRIELQKGLAIAELYNWGRIAADCYFYLSQIDFKEKSYNKALINLNKCIDRSKNFQSTLLEAYYARTEVLKFVGSDRDIVLSQQMILDLQKSVFNGEVLRGVALARSKFLHDNHQTLLNTLKKTAAVRQQLEERHVLVNTAVVSLLVVSLCFLVMVAKYLQISRDHRAQLDLKIALRKRHLFHIQDRIDKLEMVFNERTWNIRRIRISVSRWHTV